MCRRNTITKVKNLKEPLQVRKITHKTSVALSLCGLDGVNAKQLQELVAREKPAGQHHMRYSPLDLRAARYRFAGIDPDQLPAVLGTVEKLPIIISRMTKGGVGKTSVSVNIASTLAMMGYRVLFIDADSQASATKLLCDSSEGIEVKRHIGHFLVDNAKEAQIEVLAESIIPIYEDGLLDLLPADITLASADAMLVTVVGNHMRAHHFFAQHNQFLSSKYDVIVVDTAPGTTPIALAFTFAAKESGKILTVVEPNGDCLRALESLHSNLEELKVFAGATIDIDLVVNKWHPSLRHVKETMGVLYTKYGTNMVDALIPQFSGFQRQMDPTNSHSRPLVETDPGSIGAQAIIGVAKGLITAYGIIHPGLKSAETTKA